MSGANSRRVPDGRHGKPPSRGSEGRGLREEAGLATEEGLAVRPYYRREDLPGDDGSGTIRR